MLELQAVLPAVLADLTRVAQAAASGELDPALADGVPPPSVAWVTGSLFVLLGATLLPLADAFLARMAPPGARIPGAAFFARWGFRHVLIVALVLFIATGLTGRVNRHLAPSFLPQFLVSELAMVAAALAVVWIARVMHPDPLEALGLRAKGSRRAAWGGLGAFALAIPVLWGFDLLWIVVAPLLDQELEPQVVVLGLQSLSGAALGVGVLLTVVIAPLLEELVFRAFLQPLLVQNLHAPAGIVVTAAIFASLHGPAWFPVFFIALLLGWVYWRTHRLFAAIAVHALFNGLQVLMLLAASSVNPGA